MQGQAKFQRITPFFWFNDQAEEAANFYVSIFDNSKVTDMTRYSKESAQASGQKEGTVMTIAFVLDGQEFTALNGGPHFKFNEALSLVVHCENQQEIDRYWARLSEGGDPKAQQCGWLKDKYGVSWQIVPREIARILNNPDKEQARRSVAALMQMKKLDIAALQNA